MLGVYTASAVHACMHACKNRNACSCAAGNLLTEDYGGPYNLTLLPVQVNAIRGGIAFRGNYTDKDVIDFLVNVECA